MNWLAFGAENKTRKRLLLIMYLVYDENELQNVSLEKCPRQTIDCRELYVDVSLPRIHNPHKVKRVDNFFKLNLCFLCSQLCVCLRLHMYWEIDNKSWLFYCNNNAIIAVLLFCVQADLGKSSKEKLNNNYYDLGNSHEYTNNWNTTVIIII